MSFLLLVVLLGLAALPGSLTHVSVVDEIVKETTGVFHVEHRHRRNAIDEIDDETQWFLKPNQTFCFCGSENWLVKFVGRNLTVAKECAIETKDQLNLVITNNKLVFSSFQEMIKASVCLYECILRGQNLLDSDGHLNKETVKNVFKKDVFLEKGLEDIGETVVERCLTTGTGNTMISDMLLSMGRGTTCDNEAYKFNVCMLLEMVQECPDDKKRNDEPHCTNLYRSYKMSRIFSG